MATRIMRTLLGPGLLFFGLMISWTSTHAQAEEPVPSMYTLDSGDKIQIVVFGEAELSLETLLGDNGKINYPLLGEIEVNGLTIKQLEQFIADGLKGRYLVNPSVNVTVTEYRPFFVNGEVKKPGGYPFQPGLTVRKAIALAGGFTSRAAQSKVDVIEQHSSNKEPVRKDLEALVQPGDSIIVKQRFF